jgi:hypothetical protein
VATFKATALIYKQRILEAYVKAFNEAFEFRNIRVKWRIPGLWPFYPEFAEKLIPPPPSTPFPPLSPLLANSPSPYPFKRSVIILRHAKDLRDQFLAIERLKERSLASYVY